MATPVKFLTGKISALSSLAVKEGQIIFALDDNNEFCAIYHDVSDGVNTKRIQVTGKDSLGNDISNKYISKLTSTDFETNPVHGIISNYGDGSIEEEVLAYEFVGTTAEYEAVKNDLPDGIIVHITDDEEVSAQATIAVDKLPAASANHRGRILLLESNNTDKPYMCLKKSGTYAWYEIQTGTNGILGEGELPPAESGATTAKLGVAVLGTMVLGQE
jgi:hypothetical protein